MTVAEAMVAACLSLVLFWGSQDIATRCARWSLRRSLGRSDEWWRQSLERYVEFKQEEGSSFPSSSEPGKRGALGLWIDEVHRLSAAGLLTDERIEGLAQAGFCMEGVSSCGNDEQRRAAYAFDPALWQRVVLGIAIPACWIPLVMLLCEAAGVTEALSWQGIALCALTGLCVDAMAVMVVCDLRARVIPWEPCAVLAACGLALQWLVGGWQGALVGVVACLAVGASCWIMNGALRKAHPEGAIGQGDIRCMMALSLACGPGSLVGIVACYAAAGVFCLVGCALRKMTRKSGFPMAPFLALWLLVGLVACTWR